MQNLSYVLKDSTFTAGLRNRAASSRQIATGCPERTGSPDALVVKSESELVRGADLAAEHLREGMVVV